DDPANDGEHAVLGNTEVLNDFVDVLRERAARRGREENIIWFEGPTATGKSELKRCMVNGLAAYSQTPQGHRYTVEWNITTGSRGLGYSGDQPVDNEDNWYGSPVQAHPLSVLPEETREELLAVLNDPERRADHILRQLRAADPGERADIVERLPGEDAGDTLETVERLLEGGGGRAEAVAALADHLAEYQPTDIPILVEEELDPFSREAYDHLADEYRGKEDIFEQLAGDDHLRVVNYTVEPGNGVGVLHAEDEGTVKERLVGHWMSSMLRELDSRGRKNPQAFSYDGVLSQGHGGVTIVEDAITHADLLQKLLNVPEEQSVKLDKSIDMDVDTPIIIISNPDLEAALNEQEKAGEQDPMKALKRRLDRNSMNYLTELSLEVELLHRLVSDGHPLWDAEADDYEELRAEYQQAITLSKEGEVFEYAPHAIEAAAAYDIVTRLDVDDLPDDLDLVDKALLFDRGYLLEDGREVPIDDYDLAGGEDGRTGIPPTYTRDTLTDLLDTAKRDRQHPEVILPMDVLTAMTDGLEDAAVFSSAEASEFEERVVPVKKHIFERLEEDVLTAMTWNTGVDRETVEEYVDHAMAWANDGTVTNSRGEEVEPDPMTMKVFEIEHLGRFDEDDYDGVEPTEPVKRFREDDLSGSSHGSDVWRNRGDGFSAEGIDPYDIPELQDVLEARDWDDVQRLFEEFDPHQWNDPPEDTVTEEVKQQTIEHMVRGVGDVPQYTEASAELVSRHVMRQVKYRWEE
ncbi:MAG: kinase anchor protein, partial [Candidatus Nanohaloarchaea archaeon]